MGACLLADRPGQVGQPFDELARVSIKHHRLTRIDDPYRRRAEILLRRLEDRGMVPAREGVLHLRESAVANPTVVRFVRVAQHLADTRLATVKGAQRPGGEKAL